MAVLKCRTLSVSIECAPTEVYRFVSNPENLPRWATSFCRSVSKSEGAWIVDTPDGPVKLEFVALNELGVLDHRVSLRTGVEILAPMRVIPNGSGSEVLFTLFQTSEMSDEAFSRDSGMVERDLRNLKRVLEGEAARGS